MDTTTVLVVIGCGVLVKTLAFVGFVVRRDRRQRRELVVARNAAEIAAETAVAAAGAIAAASRTPRRHEPENDSAPVWRLQWGDPGVLLVENADGADAALDVRLVATLTTGGGMTSTTTHEERFVGTGACFEAAFEELRPWLSEAAAVLLGGGPSIGRSDLECELGYVLEWRTSEGAGRRQAGRDLRVVPVADLALAPS